MTTPLIPVANLVPLPRASRAVIPVPQVLAPVTPRLPIRQSVNPVPLLPTFAVSPLPVLRPIPAPYAVATPSAASRQPIPLPEVPRPVARGLVPLAANPVPRPTVLPAITPAPVPRSRESGDQAIRDLIAELRRDRSTETPAGTPITGPSRGVQWKTSYNFADVERFK